MPYQELETLERVLADAAPQQRQAMMDTMDTLASQMNVDVEEVRVVLEVLLASQEGTNQ